MNENSRIKPEERRFIYKLILEGRSDLDILNEYIYLNEIGQLNFPLRTDDSFVKDRRTEIEIASEVLKGSIKEIMKPSISKQREDHFAQLAEISSVLLQNNLHTVIRCEEMYISRYMIKDSNNITLDLTSWQLLNLFRKNIEAACKRYTYFAFYEYYVPHIRAAMPAMEAEGFWPQVEKQPYEVITTIKELTKRKELKGVCPLCIDLETRYII